MRSYCVLVFPIVLVALSTFHLSLSLPPSPLSLSLASPSSSLPFALRALPPRFHARSASTVATTMRKSPILAPIALGVLCLLRAVPVMCDRHAQPAAFPRTTVNFDYAWRYQAGSDRKYEQQCAHPEFNVSYADPSSPGQIWAGTLTSKELCCNECANHETCRAWDWNGQWCWLNENPTARKAAPGRWSGLMGTAMSSTLFWSISRVFVSPLPPRLRRVLCSTSCPSQPGADWHLQSGAVL